MTRSLTSSPRRLPWAASRRPPPPRCKPAPRAPLPPSIWDIIGVQQWQSNLYTTAFIDDNKNGIKDPGEIGIPLVYIMINYRDGHNSNILSTDFNGVAKFNETFPLFNWYVVEADSGRHKRPESTRCTTRAGPRTAPLTAERMAPRFAGPLPRTISWPTPTRRSLCPPICRYPARSTARRRIAWLGLPGLRRVTRPPPSFIRRRTRTCQSATTTSRQPRSSSPVWVVFIIPGLTRISSRDERKCITKVCGELTRS